MLSRCHFQQVLVLNRRGGIQNANLFAHGGDDLLGRVVPFGRQALDVEMSPAVALDQVDDFTGERPAGNEQNIAAAGGEGEFIGGLEVNEGHSGSGSGFGLDF